MNQWYRVERQLLLGGDELEQLMTEAGFIDVKVRVVKLEIGDWGPGLFQMTFS
jgi:hypothetical protein